MSPRAAFDYTGWQQYLQYVTVQSGLVDDCVAPFGFEVTADPQYLTRTLRRFFVYVVPRVGAQPATVEWEVVEAILRTGPEGTPTPVSDMALAVTSTQVIPLGRPGQSILYVKALPRVAGTLIDAYAQYIAGAPVLVQTRRLLEITKFERSSPARRFVFQLTIACASVYSSISSLSSMQMQTLTALIRSSKDRDLVTGVLPATHASHEEIAALHNISLPLHERCAKYLTEYFDTEPYTVLDFHAGVYHELILSRSRFSEATSFVADSCRRYPPSQEDD